MEADAAPGYELWRPNREKAESKTMKALVAFVLLVAPALLIYHARRLGAPAGRQRRL